MTKVVHDTDLGAGLEVAGGKVNVADSQATDAEVATAVTKYHTQDSGASVHRLHRDGSVYQEINLANGNGLVVESNGLVQNHANNPALAATDFVYSVTGRGGSVIRKSDDWFDFKITPAVDDPDYAHTRVVGEKPPALYLGLTIGGWNNRTFGSVALPQNLQMLVSRQQGWENFTPLQPYGFGETEIIATRGAQLRTFVPVVGSPSPVKTPRLRAYGRYRISISLHLACIEQISWQDNRVTVIAKTSSGAARDILQLHGASVKGATPLSDINTRTQTVSGSTVITTAEETDLMFYCRYDGCSMFTDGTHSILEIEYLGGA